MGLTKDTYAFDDCSILKLCGIKIPASYQIFFKNGVLTAKNYSKLKSLIDKLNISNIPQFRFVPDKNIEGNIIKVANHLLEGYNIQIMERTFKAEVLEQLNEFNNQIKKVFLEIPKEENITGIKPIFINNQKQLSKEDNIPQDDDLKIIAGYCKFKSDGNKYLISEDEHFWGYSGLILAEFNIHVIEEWKCHLIKV